jgi:hypothetical protein
MQAASTRRIVAAALAAVAFGVTTTTAQAGTVTDDFTGGHPVNTTAGAGGVDLASAFNEGFDGATLPAGWTGAATPSNSRLSVDNTRVDSGVMAGPGSSLRFRGMFGTQSFEHVGFGTTFDDTTPWAIFSTGSTNSAISARTSTGAAETVTPIAAVPGTDYDFRIDWTPIAFVYYVNGTEVARHPVPIAAQMKPLASDINPDNVISLDSMMLRTVSSGTYESKALDAGDARVVGVAFAQTSAGQVAYQTRSGSTATPGGPGWSAWGPSNATKPARYVQYRATLTAGAIDPKVTAASVNFQIDTAAPAVSIGAVKVTAGTAQVPFSSDDAKATFACSLDGRAFAACTSPARFSGLSAGKHTVVVRGRDAVGNQRTATTSFLVAGTQASDNSAPRVTVPRSMKLSPKGKVRLRLRCPADETRCKITVKLRYKGATVARKTIEVDGGKSRVVSLKVKRAVRRLVADHGDLKVTASVDARDDSGNRWTKRTRVTLKPA